MTKILISTIRLYQKTISPDHGWFKQRHPYGFCKFRPTCSEYSMQALSNQGLIKGSLLITKRLLRCHPFTQPQIDLAPPKK